LSFTPATLLSRLLIAALLSTVTSAVASAQTPPPAAAGGTVRFGPGWDNHPMFWLGSLGRIDWRLRVQSDGRSLDAPLPDGEFYWALRRTGVGGQLRGGIDFEITRELGVENAWRDVYVNVRRYPGASAQAGKFKIPFGLDQLTGVTTNDFIFRSRLGDQLSPGRERGAMLHGRVAERRLGYQVGVFVHDGGNSRTTDPTRAVAGTTLAWRVTTQPWLTRKTSPFRTLQFGGNATHAKVDGGFLGLRGRTAGRAVFYAPRLTVRGDQRRAGADVQWKPGPFSVQAEYVRAVVERRGVIVSGREAEAVTATGWYLSGTWLLTGEMKSAGLDALPHPAFTGGIGAIELAARVEALAFDSGADGTAGNGDHLVTAGVTWHLNRWLKTQFNVVHESIDDPLQGPLGSDSDFWTRVVRLQFRF
jgi:phosphate-selective porin